MIRLLLFPLHWIFVKKAFSHKRRLRESLDFLLQSIITSFRSWFCFLRRHVGCVYFFFVIMSVVFSFSFSFSFFCILDAFLHGRAGPDWTLLRTQKYWYHFHKQNYRQIIVTFFGEEIVVFFHCSLIICID
jgi:hypothetical protein